MERLHVNAGACLLVQPLIGSAGGVNAGACSVLVVTEGNPHDQKHVFLFFDFQKIHARTVAFFNFERPRIYPAACKRAHGWRHFVNVY